MTTEGSPPELREEDRRALLGIAAEMVRSAARGEEPPGFAVTRESLLTPACVFVSLHRGEMLRGCLGMTGRTLPLWEAVRDMARASATRDPRVPSISEDELEALHLEISVLSGFREIEDPTGFALGVEGILLCHGHRSALLLPQVAEQGPYDRKQFLEITTRKAGLRADAWKDPECRVEVFTCDVFGDDLRAIEPPSDESLS